MNACADCGAPAPGNAIVCQRGHRLLREDWAKYDAVHETGGMRMVGEGVASRNVFRYDPASAERNPGAKRLKPGDYVRITHPSGGPRPGTAGQYHVVHHETGRLLGVVTGSDLKKVAE